MKRVTFIGAFCVAAFSGSASAGVVGLPDGFDLGISWGTNTWNAHQNPESITQVINNADGSMTIVGAWQVSNNFMASWSVDVASDGSPITNGGGGSAFIANSFNLTNMSNSTQSFVVFISQAGGPINPASMYGSVSGSVGDGNGAGGATVSTSGPGTAFYNGLIDGLVARQAYADPDSVAAPLAGTNNIPTVNFGPEAAPGLFTSIGIRNEFTLTAHDNAQMTSTFLVIPTPGATALLGVAGFAASRRRR